MRKCLDLSGYIQSVEWLSIYVQIGRFDRRQQTNDNEKSSVIYAVIQCTKTAWAMTVSQNVNVSQKLGVRSF